MYPFHVFLKQGCYTTMSDGRFTAVNRGIVLLDVVDADWAAEKLPNDDITIPPEIDTLEELGNEDDMHGANQLLTKAAEVGMNPKKDQWADMAVAEMTEDLSRLVNREGG